MCKVKSGELLKNEADLQNMIIGIILRQQEAYLENDILEAVKYHSQKAQFPINPIRLRRMIQDNLDFLVRFRKVNCLDGIYTPISIDRYLNTTGNLLQ